jgi:hypothetical protein
MSKAGSGKGIGIRELGRGEVLVFAVRNTVVVGNDSFVVPETLAALGTFAVRNIADAGRRSVVRGCVSAKKLRSVSILEAVRP